MLELTGAACDRLLSRRRLLGHQSRVSEYPPRALLAQLKGWRVTHCVIRSIAYHTHHQVPTVESRAATLLDFCA